MIFTLEWRPTGQVSEEAHAHELKGPLLQGGRGRRHVDGHIAPGRRLEPDSGQRGEMLHQVSKAQNWQAVGRGTVIVGHSEGTARPLAWAIDIIGQHAQQNMGSHTMGLTMVDGPDLQVHGLEASKGTFHIGQALVGPDGLIRIHDLFRQADPHDIDAVQGLFLGHARGLPTPGEPIVLDGDGEVLSHLVPDPDGFQTPGDGSDALEPPVRALGRRLHAANGLFGGVQQGLPLATTLVGQQGIAAHDQTFTRKQLLAGDLHQVPFIQQGGLQRVVGHPLADHRGPHCPDPVETGRLNVVPDPRLGQHAPIPDDDHPGPARAVPDTMNGRGYARRIGCVAVTHLHRHRSAFAVAQKPELDWPLARLAVPRISVSGQIALTALHPHGCQVPQHQGVVRKMPLGQTRFNAPLTRHEPVHGGIELIGLDRAQIQQGTQAAGVAVGRQTWRRGHMTVGPRGRDRHGLRQGLYAAPPCRHAFKLAMTLDGSLERLARVRLASLSHRDSRSRTAGGELRLGTVSIYRNTEKMMEKEKASVCE